MKLEANDRSRSINQRQQIRYQLFKENKCITDQSFKETEQAGNRRSSFGFRQQPRIISMDMKVQNIQIVPTRRSLSECLVYII